MHPRLKSFAWNFLFWTVAGVFFATQVRLYGQMYGRPVTWSLALRQGMIPWYCWGLLSPAVMWLARHFQVRRKHWWRNLAVLAVTGVGFVVLKMALQLPAT